MQTIKIDFEDGIAWVTLNRPEKRNALSPTLNREMLEVLDELEVDDRCKVLVLTGAGNSFSAGMDIKEYFREVDGATPVEVMRVQRASMAWQWRRMQVFPKPTIAMVNGWCFGGAFTPLVSCDLSLAADEATFGLSEINWGIIPAGNVTRAVAEKMTQSDALYYLMKNGHVLQAIKLAYRRVKDMSWDVYEDYLYAKAQQSYSTDPERGREAGMKQFLDDKSYRPGLGNYQREPKG